MTACGRPGPRGAVEDGDGVLARLSMAACDLPTRDKVPVIRRLTAFGAPGLALDIGIGTGYTTYSVFGDRPTVCVDVDVTNLQNYRQRVTSVADVRAPLCVVANAGALPFRPGVFRVVLCSEVIEHLEDHDAALEELHRVMADDGMAVVTVPYTGLGFTSFLELFGVRTVHDYPGPEQHVRPGYDEVSMAALVTRHGLRVRHQTYYVRLFTRLATDVVSIAHLLYERLVHGRRAWTWADVAASERSVALRVYRRLFPIFWAISRLDCLLGSRRGFGLVVVLGKSTAATRAPSTSVAGRRPAAP